MSVEDELARHIDSLTHEAQQAAAAEDTVEQIISSVKNNETAVVVTAVNHLGDENITQYSFETVIKDLEDDEHPAFKHMIAKFNRNGYVSLNDNEIHEAVKYWSEMRDLMDDVQSYQSRSGGYIFGIK